MEEPWQIFWPESWRSPIGPPVMADSHWPRVMAVSHWPPSHSGLSLAPQSYRTLIGPRVIADSHWPPSHFYLRLSLAQVTKELLRHFYENFIGIAVRKELLSHERTFKSCCFVPHCLVLSPRTVLMSKAKTVKVRVSKSPGFQKSGSPKVRVSKSPGFQKSRFPIVRVYKSPDLQ